MKKLMSSAFLATGLLLGSLCAASPIQAPAPDQGNSCLAASDGGGILRLLWPVPRSGWPAGGWQVLDDSGKTLKSIRAGEGPSSSSFSTEKKSLLKTLAKGVPSFSTDQERETFFFILLAEIVSDPAFAQAAGFCVVLDKLPAGRRSYKVVGLASDGRPSGHVYPCPPIDAYLPTPPPASPAQARGESGNEGVRLFWSRPEKASSPEPLTYFIERRPGGGAFTALTGKPLFLAVNRDPAAPVFLDEDAPVETKVEYRVFGVDAFGRRSLPAEISVFHFDHSTLEPPADFKATGAQGRSVLEWKPPEGRRQAKISVWRALTPLGPYVCLTPGGLPPGTSRFEDTDIKGGLSYSYQVQVVGADDREGPRSPVATASPKNASAPSRPEGLTVEVQRTRIRLTWKAPTGTLLAGYLIERRDRSGEWIRINDSIGPETVFDDYGGSEGPAVWSYRLRAVALDNQESAPGEAVEVVVPDRSLPPPPEVVSCDGADGKAVIRFRPGRPESKTVQFVVLRSGDPRDLGVVLGRPLPGASREYTDPFVEAGAEYWYRVVAIGANGNRSEPSAAFQVRIAPPPIPTPPAPKAEIILKPHPRVLVRFAPAPQGLETVLQRRLQGEGDWLVLSVVPRGGEATDGDPPASGPAEYRVVYRTRSGVYGNASPAVTVRR